MKNDDLPYNDLILVKVKSLRWDELISFLRSHNNKLMN